MGFRDIFVATSVHPTDVIPKLLVRKEKTENLRVSSHLQGFEDMDWIQVTFDMEIRAPGHDHF